MLTVRPFVLDTLGSPDERPCPSCAVYELTIQPAITTISAQNASQRQFCVSYICKQLAYRLRHQRPASVDPVVLRNQLQRQRLLVAHTVYECARCDERYLGERRCSSCQLYCRALGLGGQCEDCDHIMLLTELLGT